MDPKEVLLSEMTQALIRIKSRKMIGCAGLQFQDLEDLMQELSLALWKRVPQYDSEKSSMESFMNMVLGQACANLLRHRNAKKRDWKREVSIEALTHDQRGDDSQSERIHTQKRAQLPQDAEEQQDTRLDVDAKLQQLPVPLRAVAERLMEDTPTVVARELGISLYQFKKHIQEIAKQFGQGNFTENY